MLISVIVPIFNTERFLERCIESIINQTYKNLDIILVDDGSTDGSYEVCMKYVAKDARIRCLRKENQGLSSAKNYGIANAYGELIAFVDSDDYIEPEMYEKLVFRMKEYSADIVICRYNEILDTKLVKENKGCKKSKKLQVFSGEEIDRLLYSDYRICVVSWNKLYKKELFNNIRYPIGKKFEDNFVVHEILCVAQKVVILDEELYNYVNREGSIMNTRTYSTNIDEVEAVDCRVKFFKEKNKGRDLILLAVRESIRKRISLYWQLVKEIHMQKDNRKRKIVKECKQIIRDNKEILQTDCPCEFIIFIYCPLLGILISKLRLKKLLS